MRVTQNMINRNLQYAISDNLELLGKLNEQLSTGLRVNRVSDDVSAAGKIMRMQRENSTIDIYLQNLGTAEGVLSVASSSLQTASETVSSLKERAIQAASGTLTASDRLTLADGVDGLLDTLLNVANVSHSGAYVFSGEATETLPFQATYDENGDVSSVVYAGGLTSTEARVGSATTTRVNLVGKDVFQSQGDIFQTAIELRDAMRADDVEEIQRLLDELDDCHAGIRRAMGQVGERQNQLTSLRQTAESLKALNEELISDSQDADVAALSIQYNSSLTILQAALKVAASAVLPSLAEYL